MSDIRSVFMDMEHGADFALAALGLADDDGLDTAVIISLFTDRRAEDGDVIPDGTNDKRGHWSDAFPDVPGDRIGSRLWLLDREKQLQEVLNRARDYIEESLAWMVADGAARSVDVETFIPRNGILGAIIQISRPDGNTTRYTFENFWSA